MADGIAPTVTGNGHVDVRLDDIVSLVLACSRGEVGHDAVENALSSIVGDQAPPGFSGDGDGGVVTAATSDRIARTKRDVIIPDVGNYDDDSEDEKQAKEAPYADAVSKSNAKEAVTERRRSCTERREALEKIPLGKMGERMLITFGDGPFPDLDVISSALLGTRATLQRAILDARALRRYVSVPYCWLYLCLLNQKLIRILIPFFVKIPIMIGGLKMIGIRRVRWPQCTEERLRPTTKSKRLHRESKAQLLIVRCLFGQWMHAPMESDLTCRVDLM
jgi:hypothetical protein